MLCPIIDRRAVRLEDMRRALEATTLNSIRGVLPDGAILEAFDLNQ